MKRLLTVAALLAAASLVTMQGAAADDAAMIKSADPLHLLPWQAALPSTPRMKRAHARLLEATPEINSTIAAPPTEIRLRFSRKRLAG
ncbi:copper resistance protein CopC [Mesorhizobium sp. M0991]|uniref:hypothetical protein n=1 Tax=Mesorhizobium sp. M0991 TaxID=2957043 RepID=UPI003338E57A